MVNTPNTAASANNYYANKPEKELQKNLDQAVKAGNYAEADLIMHELKSRKGVQDKLDLVKSFDQKIEDFRGSLEGLSEKERNKKLNSFFENDLKTYQTQVKTDHIPILEAKEREIQKLQAILGENAMELPTAREILSPKTRSLSNLNKKITKFKEDKQHYPKNFLIYAMGMTYSDLFGIGKKFKRMTIKLLWKWKSEDIANLLSTLEHRLKDQSTDKNRTRTMKYRLRQELELAKKAYVEQQAEKVYGKGKKVKVEFNNNQY